MWPKKHLPSIDPLSLERHSLIAKSEAVPLIASEVRKTGESFREVRDRVRKRIEYAVKTGKLKQDHRRQIVFGELAVWAQKNWPGKFKDWPTQILTGEVESTLEGIASDIRGILLPENLKACHERIEELEREVQALRRGDEAQAREIAELRPIKARDDERRRKSRESAGMPRGRRMK